MSRSPESTNSPAGDALARGHSPGGDAFEGLPLGFGEVSRAPGGAVARHDHRLGLRGELAGERPDLFAERDA